MNQREDYATIMCKVIQDYIKFTTKKTEDNLKMISREAFISEFEPFYNVLLEKALILMNFADESPEWDQWSSNLSIDKQSKKEHLQKTVTMRYSIIFYTDMMTHIMILIEDGIVDNYSEFLWPKFERILTIVIEALLKIDLNRFKEEQSIENSRRKIQPIYYEDTIYMMNKIMSLISKLIQKNKSPPSGSVQGQGGQQKNQSIAQKLADKIENLTEKGQKLVNLVVDLQKLSSHSSPTLSWKLPSQKFDCFLNIRGFSSVYPNLILKRLDDILEDSFFKKSRNHWSVNEVNNIYHAWL